MLLLSIEHWNNLPKIIFNILCWKIEKRADKLWQRQLCSSRQLTRSSNGVPTFHKIWPVLNKERAARKRNLAELSVFPRLLLYWPLMKLWVSGTDNICVCIHSKKGKAVWRRVQVLWGQGELTSFDRNNPLCKSWRTFVKFDCFFLHVCGECSGPFFGVYCLKENFLMSTSWSIFCRQQQTVHSFAPTDKDLIFGPPPCVFVLNQLRGIIPQPLSYDHVKHSLTCMQLSLKMLLCEQRVSRQNKLGLPACTK